MEDKTRENYSGPVFPGSGAPCRSDGAGNPGNLLNDFVTSWKNFDGAGSRFLYSLCTSLAESQYEGLSRDLVAVLGPVFGCGESELVLCHLRKMEAVLGGLQAVPGGAGNQDVKAEAKDLMRCRCLLQFLKLQAEYHQLCSNTLSSVINHIVSTSDTQPNSDLLQEIQDLRSLDHTRSQTQSPTRSLGNKKGHSGTGSPRTQKHGFKASLFSLFERKNSPEEGNSSFYVDIGQGERAVEGRRGGVEGGHVTDGGQSQMLVQLGLDPGKPEDSNMQPGNSICDKSPSTRLLMPTSDQAFSVPSAHTNGEVATQEELDSVINLLSGVGVASHMQTIPELTDSTHLRVPAPTGHASSLSPATSDYCIEERAMARGKGQRRSEGSIDLSGFGAGPPGALGTNTWPYQHRSSLPGGQLATYSQVLYDFSAPLPAGYNVDVRPTTLPPGGAGHFQAGYNWGFPDPKLNRTWPLNNLTGTGSVTDTINSSWSGAQDSDELSDDSSCGDQLHNMAHLHTGDRRREIVRDDTLAPVKRDERVGDVKHHSLEDLLDGRSNTWPQQFQPWSQSQHGLDLMDPGGQAGQHRPLHMQLSDPLSRRNVWPNSGDPSNQQLSQPQTAQALRHV